ALRLWGMAPATGTGFAGRVGRFGIKISGCPNSCGQHHVGDIGLTGHSVREDDGTDRPYYSIRVGGSVGEGRGRVGQRLGRFPEQDTPAAIAGVARFYEERRQAGETFPAFVDRIGLKELAGVAARAVEGAASGSANRTLPDFKTDSPRPREDH